MTSFMICSAHETFFGGNEVEEDEMDRMCVTYGREQKYIQDFGGETWREKTTCKI